jgi:hypothetical protein
VPPQQFSRLIAQTAPPPDAPKNLTTGFASGFNKFNLYLPTGFPLFTKQKWNH